MLQDFLKELIVKELFSGSLSEAQAAIAEKVFSAMPEEHQGKVREILEKEPRLIPFVFHNIGRKMAAFESDDEEAWDEIIKEELSQLDGIAKQKEE